MYKVKEITENSSQKKDLIQLSGYCIIILIANQIVQKNQQIDEDIIISEAFVEYDYSNRADRQSNKYYIDAAHKYIERNKAR